MVTNNDVDGNVLKANGTAAKVSQVEISSSEIKYVLLLESYYYPLIKLTIV